MSVRAGDVAGARDPIRGPAADFGALLEPVARRLLADRPCRRDGGDLRFGRRGSLVVHLGGDRAGTWRNYEADASGGTLRLIEHVLNTDHAGALAWLVAERLIEPPAADPARNGTRTAAPRRNGAHNGPVGDFRPAPGVPGPPRNGHEPPAAPPTAPASSPTAAVARAILDASTAADGTPAALYLARRGTWPASCGPLPGCVRWLPAAAARTLPTWADGKGRPLHLNLPSAPGTVTRLHGPPQPPDGGAVVYLLADPRLHAEPAVSLEAVSADGRRLDDAGGKRWRRTLGDRTGRCMTVEAPPGGPWPDAAAPPLVVAIAEGEADALALARLRLPGVLVRAAGGTAGMSAAAALVADLAPPVAVCLVSDGDHGGRAAVTTAHAALHATGRPCCAVVLAEGDPDALLRGADAADLADRHGERAAVLEYDGQHPRPAAAALALRAVLLALEAARYPG